jgi:hypothetical protein
MDSNNKNKIQKIIKIKKIFLMKNGLLLDKNQFKDNKNKIQENHNNK